MKNQQVKAAKNSSVPRIESKATCELSAAPIDGYPTHQWEPSGEDDNCFVCGSGREDHAPTGNAVNSTVLTPSSEIKPTSILSGFDSPEKVLRLQSAAPALYAALKHVANWPCECPPAEWGKPNTCRSCVAQNALAQAEKTS